MAIEIDEMVVRASTGRPVQSGTVPVGSGAPNGGGTAPAGAGDSRDLEEMKKALLAECREMLMEILADREER